MTSDEVFYRILIAIVALGVLWVVMWKVTDQCEQRGGHMAPVYGGRGGMVCVGDSR